MVKSEQMQYRGVQIWNRGWLLDGVVSKLVGCTVDLATFYSSAGHPHGEPTSVMISSFTAFSRWCASELATP